MTHLYLVCNSPQRICSAWHCILVDGEDVGFQRQAELANGSRKFFMVSFRHHYDHLCTENIKENSTTEVWHVIHMNRWRKIRSWKETFLYPKCCTYQQELYISTSTVHVNKYCTCQQVPYSFARAEEVGVSTNFYTKSNLYQFLRQENLRGWFQLVFCEALVRGCLYLRIVLHEMRLGDNFACQQHAKNQENALLNGNWRCKRNKNLNGTLHGKQSLISQSEYTVQVELCMDSQKQSHTLQQYTPLAWHSLRQLQLCTAELMIDIISQRPLGSQRKKRSASLGSAALTSIAGYDFFSRQWYLISTMTDWYERGNHEVCINLVWWLWLWNFRASAMKGDAAAPYHAVQ